MEQDARALGNGPAASAYGVSQVALDRHLGCHPRLALVLEDDDELVPPTVRSRVDPYSSGVRPPPVVLVAAAPPTSPRAALERALLALDGARRAVLEAMAADDAVALAGAPGSAAPTRPHPGIRGGPRPVLGRDPTRILSKKERNS